MIETTFINSTLAQYTDKDFSWVQELLMSKGYLADKDTGVATFQVTENSPTAHSVIIGAGHLLADFTKGGKTWKVKVYNDSATVLSVPQNVSGVTKYAHIIVKIDNSVNPNAVKSNVASFVSVPLTTATPTAGDIQAVIGAGMDYYSLGYVTQVNSNPVITNAMITNSSVKVTLSKAIDIPSTAVVYASGYFSGTTYPVSPFVGQFFYKTTAPIGMAYWTGSAWEVIPTSATVPSKLETYTANGDISAKQAVYITSNDTVKGLAPSGFATPTTIATACTSARATKSLPLSTSGMYLHIAGGDWRLGGALVAQVRTMNALETDFTNGSEAIIYNTSNGVNAYDVVSIGVDKFMFIFQCNTAGSGAGIKCVVVTVSGTTVTVGSIQGIESTGQIQYTPAVAKLNTDKALIMYQKDSDGDFYAQVLTVSGTTISTNSTYLIKAISGTGSIIADQYATDQVMCIYSSSGDGTNHYARMLTVSGTVVTVQTENNILTTGGAGSGSWGQTMRVATATKALFVCSENNNPTNDRIFNIAISGYTMTASSSLAYNTGHYTSWYGIAIINSKYALVSQYAGNTSIDIWFLNISGTAPTKVSGYAYGFGTTSNNYQGCALVKVAPWTYVSDAYSTDADYIFKLIPASSNIVGVAGSAIADTVVGSINTRFQKHDIWSGLTAGTKYYIDDNGQETSKSSLTAPVLGIATNATSMLLQ